MAIVGTITGTIAGAPVGLLTDWQQPNGGGGGGGGGYPDVGDPSVGISEAGLSFNHGGATNPFGAGVWRNEGGSILFNEISGNEVRAYSFDPAGGEDITDAVDTTDTLSDNGTAFNPHWNHDGTVFTIHIGSTCLAYECSTPGDISTRGTVITSPSLAGTACGPCHLSPDGLKLYAANYDASTLAGTIYEYDLSVANDVSTAVINQSADVRPSTSGYIRDMDFSSDGTTIWMAAQISGALEHLIIAEMSTPWDISTATVVHTESWSSIGIGGSNHVSISVDDYIKTLYVGDRTAKTCYEVYWTG